VNGLTGTRRLARPVRLALAQQLGSDIDGAWWPHTGVVADELPELIEVLHKPLGEIVDICINWSASEAAVDVGSMVTVARLQRGERRRRFRLMMVAGRQFSAKLLVVPHVTPQALGIMVMRCAAARPDAASQRDTQLYETAESVVRAARDESSSWVHRIDDLDNGGSAVAQGVSHVSCARPT
jgi:hypothetical protein